MSQNDATGTEEEHTEDDAKLLTICPECGLMEAFTYESHEQAMMDGEDPGQEHYLETDHSCGTFQPAEDSPLAEAWGVLYNNGDQNELESAEHYYQLARGEVEA